MKIPEPLFVLINKVVSLLLKSPLHSLMSRSVLLVTYTGRKSGRVYSTPVRYALEGELVRCFTSPSVQWWRNVKANPEVTLLIAGTPDLYAASVLDGDPSQVQKLLTDFLALYPQDAVYQDIRLQSDGSLNPDDLVQASQSAIVVEFRKR